MNRRIALRLAYGIAAVVLLLIPTAQSLAAPTATPTLAPFAVPTATPAATAAPTPPSLPGGGLKASITPAGAYLQADGSMELTLQVSTLYHDAGPTLYGVTAYYQSAVLAEFGDLAPGHAPQTLRATVTLSEAQLGTSQTVVFSWTENDADMSVPVTFTVKSSTGMVGAVTVERSFSIAEIFVGEQATVSYVVKNIGNLPVLNLVVTDGMLGVVGTRPQLEVGETWAFSVSPKLMQTLASAPVVTGNTLLGVLRETCEAQTLTVLRAFLQSTIKLNHDGPIKVGDDVQLVGELINKGDCPLMDVRLELDGVVIAQIATLGLGELLQVDHNIQITTQNLLTMTLYALTPANAEYKRELDQIDLFADLQSGAYNLSVSVIPDRTRLTEPGAVQLTVSVTNNGAVPISGIRIITDELGSTPRPMEDIQPGQYAQDDLTMSLNESRAIYIRCEYTGPNGQPRYVSAAPLYITIGEEENTLSKPGGFEDFFMRYIVRTNNLFKYLVALVIALGGTMMVVSGMHKNGVFRKKTAEGKGLEPPKDEEVSPLS